MPHVSRVRVSDGLFKVLEAHAKSARRTVSAQIGFVLDQWERTHAPQGLGVPPQVHGRGSPVPRHPSDTNGARGAVPPPPDGYGEESH